MPEPGQKQVQFTQQVQIRYEREVQGGVPEMLIVTAQVSSIGPFQFPPVCWVPTEGLCSESSRNFCEAWSWQRFDQELINS